MEGRLHRPPKISEVLTSEDAWDRDVLKGNKAGQVLAADILRIEWRAELEAYYFQASAISALGRGRAPSPLEYAESLPRGNEGLYQSERRLAAEFFPGRISPTFQDFVLERILAKPSNINLIVALARGSGLDPNFTLETFDRMHANHDFYEQFTRWARDTILRLDTPHGMIPSGRRPAAAQNRLPTRRDFWRSRSA